MLKLKFSMILVGMCYLFTLHTVCTAVVLNKFGIINDNCNKSIIILSFQGNPIYKFYFLHHPERLVMDISHIILPMYHEKFPVKFSNKNMIHCIYINKTVDKNSIRFVFDLSYVSCVDDILLESINGYYTVLLIVTRNLSSVNVNSSYFNLRKEGVTNSNVRLSKLQKNKSLFCEYVGNKLSKRFLSCPMKIFTVPIVVAIDAGHGGHDPGAMGFSGLYEKDITIAIAKKFKKLLDVDPMFDPIMIREGDYYISVLERSELARNKGAKILLSIHADAISNSVRRNNIRGASVWILSDRRADIEMTHCLANRNKLLQLFGGVSDMLGEYVSSDPYFNRVILDLQFSHSQKVGYDIALKILRELENIGVLHKYVPEYSDFGILRSLDIPSVLIETGFITHAGEEKLLGSDFYQDKIAFALYKGLRSYFMEYISYDSKRMDSERSYNIENMSGKML